MRHRPHNSAQRKLRGFNNHRDRDCCISLNRLSESLWRIEESICAWAVDAHEIVFFCGALGVRLSSQPIVGTSIIALAPTAATHPLTLLRMPLFAG